MEHTQSNRSENGGRATRRGSLAKRLKDDTKSKIESGKRSAADQIDQIADALDVAGGELDQQQPTIASYASQVATGAGKLANHLRSSSTEDLVRDVRNVAARNPMLFILGGIALGAVLTRFMRLSDTGASDLGAQSPADPTGSQTTSAEPPDAEPPEPEGMGTEDLWREESAPELDEQMEEQSSFSQRNGSDSASVLPRNPS